MQKPLLSIFTIFSHEFRRLIYSAIHLYATLPSPIVTIIALMQITHDILTMPVPQLLRAHTAMVR